MKIHILASITAAAFAMSSCTSDVEDLIGDVSTDVAGGQGKSGIRQEALGMNYDPASREYFDDLVGNKVLFSVDQSVITPESANILDRQADWLMVNPAYSVLVEGHADERGTREYNLALGARRASAIQDYLHNRGISDNRIRTVTYGKERPVAVCSDESCWSENRRGVTVVSVPDRT